MMHDPQMVERVARELWPIAFGASAEGFEPPENVDKLRRLASAALEAAHHTELVKALRDLLAHCSDKTDLYAYTRAKDALEKVESGVR